MLVRLTSINAMFHKELKSSLAFGLSALYLLGLGIVSNLEECLGWFQFGCNVLSSLKSRKMALRAGLTFGGAICAISHTTIVDKLERDTYSHSLTFGLKHIDQITVV